MKEGADGLSIEFNPSAPSFTTPQPRKSYPVKLVDLDPEDEDDDVDDDVDDDLEHSRPNSATSPSTPYPENNNNTIQCNDNSLIDNDLHLILAKRPRSDAFFGVCHTYFYRTHVLRKHGEKELACERL